MDVAITATIVMVVALVIILLMGAPIAVAIGMSSAMAMVVILPTNVALVTCAQKMFTGLNSFPLLAIPFFVLAGNLMNNGGIAIRIIRLAEALCGRLPGALAESNVLANMFFGAISGSGNAAAAAMGGTIGPIEAERGYSKEFSAAVNIASAPTGMLIPPSNALIVFFNSRRVNFCSSTVYGRIYSRNPLGLSGHDCCRIHGEKTRIYQYKSC